MMRKRKTLNLVIALLLVFALSFPMGINANAIDGNQLPDQLLQTTTPAIVPTTPDAISEGERTLAPAVIPSQLPKELKIETVQVVNGGEIQAKHRNSITKGNDGKYYTSSKSASMTDARIFRVNTTVSYADLGIRNFSEFKTNKLVWTYGGTQLSDWKKYDVKAKTFTGDQAILPVEGSISAKDNTTDQTITITADILFDAFYPAITEEPNIPYEGYTATTKGGYPDFVKGKILGTYPLNLSYEKENVPTLLSSKDNSLTTVLASKDIKLNLYDSFHTWDEIDQLAKDLQKESNSSNHVMNQRYVSVEPIGQSMAGRNIWNVVIAKDEKSVEDYFNKTKPLMESDPKTLINEIDNANAVGSGYHKIPLYFNNVHPDETPASDAIIELVNTFINGDKLSFETQTDVKHVDKTKDANGYTIEGNKNSTERKELTVDNVLDKFILVFNFTENPDGRANLVRTNDYGFDLNRDAAYQTQPEATALTSNIVKWDPLSMLEYHGYVTELLIEPCTGPHDPNYEYDLYADRMLKQGNTLGKAMIGNTGYSQYLVPATDYPDGWDDGAPVYGPMFAMLYGVMGYTLEIPHATQDSKDACFTAGLALAKDCLDNRKDYLSNKLIYKQRGIDNEDNKAVDQYLKDPYTGDQVGRPRVEGQSFFPEYYVIPVDDTNQRNPLEAYKTLQFLERNGASLDITTVPVTYHNQVFPAGTYVINMHQANRGFVNSMLSNGYDASNFADIYAELVISYPDMRNFDCTTVFEKNIFTGKIENKKSSLQIPSTNISGISEKVVVKNNNIDVIKLINRLLNNNKPVQILTKDCNSAKKGDFIIYRSDLITYEKGLLVFGNEFTESSSNIKTLVKPNISILGSSTFSKYVLDLLEFTGDYKYVDANSIPNDTNVIVGFNSNTNVADKISGSGIGYIGIGTNALKFAKTSNLLPGFDYAVPGESYNEGLVKATYSTNSLITANYNRTVASYIMNGAFITSLPTKGEALITISNSPDFFKAGWFPKHDVLKGKTLAVSGYTGSKGDVPVTLFSNNIFSKGHAQYNFNMFANAIYLSSSKIPLDGKIEDNSNNNGGGHSHSHSSSSTVPTTTPTPAAITPTPAAITPTPAAFSDIQKHWASSSIKFVTDKKLFDGVSKGKFAPDATMTRGMLVTVLGRAYGVNVSDYNKKSSFLDVPESAYYAPYVVWASEKGVIKGSGNDKFLPNQAVKRGEMAVIIANYMKFIGKDADISSTTLNYADKASIPSWAINGVKLVTQKGLMTGTSGNRFDFNGLSTRAQVATVLERLLKLQ